MTKVLRNTRDRILRLPAGMPAYNSKKPVTEPDKVVEKPEAEEVQDSPVETEAPKSITTKPEPTTADSSKKNRGETAEEGFYTRFFKQNNPDGPRTKEQIEADEKRRRRNAIISAVGDGISALSNLYFTTKGAPSSFNPKESMSKKMYERYERLRKEREAKDKVWLNGYMQAQRLDELSAKARHDAILKKQALDQKAEEIQNRKKKDDELLEISREKNRILKEYYDNKKTKEEADREIRELNARANMLRAQNQGNGQTTTVEIERDALGRETKRTTTKGQGNNNVPPSRRGNADNVPPSRKNGNSTTPPSRRK